MPPLSSPFFSSFHPSFSLFHLGRMAGSTQNSTPVPREEPRSQNSTTFFFPFVEKKLHCRGNVRSSWPNFFYQDYLERSWEEGEEGGGGEDNLYHPGAATRNGFCLLRREQIIFCCKSMDPRVFNQILQFFARGGGYDGKDGLDLNGFRLG